VDTPIRVVVLIVAIWLTWPGYFEADTPAYVICQVLSAILMLAACWRPGLATAIGAVGVVAYGVMFAQYHNAFTDSLMVSMAVALSHARIGVALAALTGQVLSWIIASVSDSAEGGTRALAELTPLVAMVLILSVSAWFLQKRIDTDADRSKAEAARFAELRVRDRVQYQLEAHDSVGHSLTTEWVLLRQLSEGELNPNQKHLVDRLLQVNSRAASQVKHLFLKDELEEGATVTEDFPTDVEHVVEALKQDEDPEAIQFFVGDVPRTVPLTVAADASAIITELASNVLRHGTGEGDRYVRVDVEARGGERTLVLESGNPAEQAPVVAPHTVDQRVSRHPGGRCDVAYGNDSVLVVRALIPLPPTTTEKRTWDGGPS
jgi:signal transduction histidine kinase